ncbi:MAG TPA: DUF1684 domain-containing protein [Puia sp.]|uniref:DUF1684 domain-containing protein n=1 Tax=Puia sp. TaxID=2045100 RepID=UPI002C40C235|nr:DUF1684 domain-containing protein [Puia sp.]HVU98425.1 DUF1684 domain-containing protein [Puia sp.]
MKPCTVIIQLLLLFSSTAKLTHAQTPYIDSMQAWRNNYVNTHELLKTPEERSLLRFYPLDAAYKVECTFEKVSNSPWLPMPTSGTVTKMARKYGVLSFRLHDTVMHLVVFQMQQLLAKEGTKDYLFVGFTDATSALDTYGAGRYIDCTTADIHGDRMTLDFNKAYNPYCAYTTGYNCPIPPRENDLPVAILAGEKNYGKKVH